MVNIRERLINLPLQEYRVSLETTWSDEITHLMDLLEVGVLVH